MKRFLLNLTLALVAFSSSCSKSDIEDTSIKDITVSTSHITSISALIDITTLNEAYYYELNLLTPEGDSIFQYEFEASPSLKYTVSELHSNTSYVVNISAINTEKRIIAQGQSKFTTKESLPELLGFWRAEKFNSLYSYTFYDDGTGSYVDTEYKQYFQFHWHAEDSQLRIETHENYQRYFNIKYHFLDEDKKEVYIDFKSFKKLE